MNNAQPATVPAADKKPKKSRRLKIGSFDYGGMKINTTVKDGVITFRQYRYRKTITLPLTRAFHFAFTEPEFTFGTE